jgi:hypothetical protein
MNITSFSSNGNAFVNFEYIKGYSFKNAGLWVNCVLLPVICAGFALLQDSCVHFSRIDCLLPHNCPA